MLPTLEECYRYTEGGWLAKHETDSLVGFKYTLNTTYGLHWDNVTLQCRGIVFEKSTGNVVAHPFDKFFNYGEIFTQEGELTELAKQLSEMPDFQPDVTEIFLASEKIDGSLIICFHYGNEWILKTGGHFYNEQSAWAKKWFDAHVNTERMYKDCTYCFEMVSKGDVHVIHYDYTGLVLLAIFTTDTHAEFNRFVVEAQATWMGIEAAPVIEGIKDLHDCVEKARKLDLTHEGFVVRFDSGFRLKLKGDEYLDMFKRINSITYRSIREHFDYNTGKVDLEYVKSIPEEMVGMREYVSTVESKWEDAVSKVKGLVSRLGKIEDARERFETACLAAKEYDCENLVKIAINIVKNGDFDHFRADMWKRVNQDLKSLYKDE